MFAGWAIEKSENQNLGLLIGEQSNIAALGIVGQVIKSSNSVQQGLEQAIRFFNLFSNVLSLTMEIKGGTLSLVFDLDGEVFAQYPEACKQLVLSSMLFSVKEVYFLTLQNHNPSSISLAFTPENKDEIKNHFNSEVIFNSHQFALHFDQKIISLPIVYSDYELMITLEKLACKRLTEQNNAFNDFSDIVRSVIYTLIDPYLPNLLKVAKQLNMSERSLQRKLKQENTSFTRIITDIKKDLAENFLSKDISVKETSYLLGYSEPSAFIKAFQSWYGKTPQKFKG
jgi:AraC-like DNA-binding protein